MENIIVREPRHIYEFYEDYLNGIVHGVIKLAVPVLNINEYSGGHPNMIALALNISTKKIDSILDYRSYVVTDPETSDLGQGQIITEDEYRDTKRYYDFQVLTGAEALLWLLSILDFKKERSEEGKNEKYCLQQADELENEDLTKEEMEAKRRELEISLDCSRLRIDALFYVQNHFERLFIKEINLFPENIRIILNEEAKDSPYSVKMFLRFLYQRVANRNCRLERLLTLDSPDILTVNEKLGLQAAVDNLFGNGKRNAGLPWERSDENIDRRFSYASLSDIILRHTNLW